MEGRILIWLVVLWWNAGWGFEAKALDLTEPYPPGLHKLPGFINTPHGDEIAPIWTRDGNTMYFTRMKDPNFNKTLVYENKDLYKELSYREYTEFVAHLFRELGDEENRKDIYKSPYNQDIFYVKNDKGKILELIHPPYPLNNALPNSVCAIMPDQRSLVLMNQFYHNGSMYKGFSTSYPVGDQAFSFPEPLHIYDFKERSGTDANLTLSANGEVMILAFSEEAGENTDLYVSFRVNQDIYSSPIRLEGVNSEFREFSPSLSEDGRLLFFSSTRGNAPYHSNIYMSERLDDTYTRWSTPQKLMEPVNSRYNEGHPFILGSKLYFASDRDGSWDIFYFDFKEYREEKDSPPLASIPDQLLLDLSTSSAPLKRNSPLKKEVDVFLPQAPKISSVRIKVVDSETGEALQGTVLKLEEENPNVRFTVNKDGFIMRFDRHEITTFFPEIEGYIAKPRKYDIAAMLKNAETIPELLIPVDAIKVDRQISMDPIFFQRATDKILQISHGELKRLSEILRTHPDIHILIKGHTDNFGDIPALTALSYRRAQAVKEFLMNEKINENRIAIRGVGPKEPLTDNSTEELKAKNRRVEVIITKTNS